MTIPVDKYVVRLYVAMDEPHLVDTLNSACKLGNVKPADEYTMRGYSCFHTHANTVVKLLKDDTRTSIIFHIFII